MNGTFENMIKRYSEELMKMNREKLINAFEEYASNYNLKDPNIYLKYIPTAKDNGASDLSDDEDMPF